jgi:shikimate kinase
VKRHVVLVGPPGAGKTTAGRAAARLLGCPFRDLDDDVVAQQGATIPHLFRERGEPAFRAAERLAMHAALAQPPHVIAPGGGWAAQPGNVNAVRGRVLLLHLRCSPESAAARLVGTDDRPLLAGGDRLEILRRLSAGRERFYALADAAVDTDDRTVEDVARSVVLLARTLGGW